MNLALHFAALYVSQFWYVYWSSDRCLYSKARAVILYDRIITNRNCVQLNGLPLLTLLTD